jgi:hypothetical protein
MSFAFKNHKQVLRVEDRHGKVLEEKTIDGWEDEGSWDVDLDTQDSDLYEDSDGEGEFEWNTEETVHSALLSEKICTVRYNGRYVGRYIHTHECEMAE